MVKMKTKIAVNNIILKGYRINERIKSPYFIKRFSVKKNGFGMNEILGIAAGLIIAALIVVPGLKTFTGNIMTKLNEWWSSVQDVFFSDGATH